MFIISKVVTAFISPLGAAIIGGLLAILAGFAGRRRLALGLGAVACVALVLAFTRYQLCHPRLSGKPAPCKECQRHAKCNGVAPPTSALVFGDSKVVDYFRFSSFIKAFHA